MNYETATHSLKDYSYFNVGPLNKKYLNIHEWKPTENKYNDHYKYFSYLYKLGRIHPEQGIVKFIAPQSVMDRIMSIDYDRLFNKEISADIQTIAANYNSENEMTGAKISVCGKQRCSLNQIFGSNYDFRIREITSLETYMKKYWELIATTTADEPYETLCGSYVDDRDLIETDGHRDKDLDFTSIVNLNQSLDMLEAVRPREDVHYPKIIVGSSGSYSSTINDDIDLLSVSVMYCGRPKVYYVIPESEFEKYAQLVRRNFYRVLETRCETNCFIIPPHILDEARVKYATIAQNPGDIVYVFGKTIWYCISTGPSLEQIGSCGHYTWGKSLTDRLQPSSLTLKYKAITYEEDEMAALDTYVKHQELLWDRNREKRLKIKAKPDYLDRRREYDRRAKAKQTPEQRNEMIRRRSLTIAQKRFDDPNAYHPKRNVAPSRYVAGRLAKHLIKTDDSTGAVTDEPAGTATASEWSEPSAADDWTSEDEPQMDTN